MKKNIWIPLFSFLLLFTFTGLHSGCSDDSNVSTSTDTKLIYPDNKTLFGSKDFHTGYPALNKDGTFNVVVEIPAGTNDKWEVSKIDGTMEHTLENGRLRVVQYLPYPCNYGMIPRTILPIELGGDNDPMDVLLLGPTLERGSVVKARLLGVLKLIDQGENDHKLIAVSENSPLSSLKNLKELDEKYPGITLILEAWFSNYKGPKETKSMGYGSREEADELLTLSSEHFEERFAR